MDMPGMPQIHVSEPTATIPLWAQLERNLISLMNEAVDVVLEQYLTPEGELLWPDVPDFQTFAYGNMDNAFESFHNWPLFYLLGGDKRFLELAHRQHEALIRQFSRVKKINLGIDPELAKQTGRDTLLVDEYHPDLDWMHQGEAAQFFYLLTLADPGHPKNRERAVRFASLVTNEYPDVPEPNYDPQHRVFRSSQLGSNGPGFRKFNRPYRYGTWLETYGLPFYDVPGVLTILDLKDPEKAERYGRAYAEKLQRADTVTNLLATSMLMNAYMHTGEEKYSRWILDYIEGWRERYADSATGVMPDNAGPTGRVGETLDGKWYGGHYGWTFPHGFYFIGDALVIAGQNERLLTGADGRLNWAREQVEMLMSHAIEDEQGRLLLPQKYAEPESVIEYRSNNPVTRPDRVTDEPGFSRLRQIDGWYEFVVQDPAHVSYVYMDTFQSDDMKLIKRLRDPNRNVHEQVTPDVVNAKNMGGQYLAYMNYLDGGYSHYPVDALQHSIDQVYGKLRKIHEETTGGGIGWGYRPSNQQEYELLQEVTRQINAKYNRQFSETTVHSYYQTFLMYRNTVTTEALVHLTMGGLLPVFNGGLLQVAVRYYDADERRPGLPSDVAALVKTVKSDEVSLTLCNIHPTARRTLVVQAGAFGEHQFETVRFTCGAQQEQTLNVEGRWFEVCIGPGCLVDVVVQLRRFANSPSYVGPFD